MEFLRLILLAAVCYTLVSGSSRISKKDFKKLNIACYKEFSCREYENSKTFSGSCECDELCFQRGTCCYDSYYRDLKPSKITPSCKILNEEDNFGDIAYSLVDQCPYGGNLNPSWENLCKSEWTGGDDMIKLVPVISMHSFITYKNYFCFRCHELVDEFLFWNVRFESEFEIEEDVPGDVKLTYDKINKSWMAPVGEKYKATPVKITLEIPNNIYGFPKRCRPNVISHCSETWSDNDVSDKCKAYMAIVYIKRNGTFFQYKNPHCAICNFENLDNLFCLSEYLREPHPENLPDSSSIDIGDHKAFDENNVTSYLEWYESFYTLTSKNRLININIFNEKETRPMWCNGNFLWDPFERECKTDICALPIYMLEMRECI